MRKPILAALLAVSSTLPAGCGHYIGMLDASPKAENGDRPSYQNGAPDPEPGAAHKAVSETERAHK